MAREDGTLQLYDVSVGGKPMDYSPAHMHSQEEYEKSREITQFPDTFPCGHVLCHQCVRRYVARYPLSAWCCPLCDRELFHNNNQGETTVVPDTENEEEALLVNLDEIVKKFNGINHSIRRIRTEEVQTRSVGVTYSACPCDMCGHDHGKLSVIQEYSDLRVEHNRPSISDRRFCRLANSTVVTTFHSKINSACVCVPCTFREIQDHPDQYYALTEWSNHNEENTNDSNYALAEVGKLLTRRITPVKALQGKNMIEIEHNIRISERGDLFDFRDTSEQIKRTIGSQEKNLVKIARKRIEDTGHLYHVQESNTVDYSAGETVV
ncbi:uncharacterized protein LOC117327087 [Pecten maximus]|uniref:uncharacterized protein LOC117327087 n=1 Tax=Pecten maximus TaxID=6579 RepID=UPI001457FE77|nr:uncharacterized protein LOC117327087 [Pecten maximus]